MKAILVPTDFSAVCSNAIEYAAEIARAADAKLFLFHVYQIPVIISEVPVAIPSLNEIENECMDLLKKIKQQIDQASGKKIAVECYTKCGAIVDEIDLFASENNIDLIVMGMRGAGILSEKLIGSTTTELIQESKFPVLVINEKMKFKKLDKIVLASDYEKVSGKSILNTLLELIKIFNSKLYVLNVVNEDETIPSRSNAIAGINLENDLEGINHSFHFIENNNTTDGINEFALSESVDLIVLVSRKHNLLQRIFQESNTKKMAFHTSIPLLALHE